MSVCIQLTETKNRCHHVDGSCINDFRQKTDKSKKAECQFSRSPWQIWTNKLWFFPGVSSIWSVSWVSPYDTYFPIMFVYNPRFLFNLEHSSTATTLAIFNMPLCFLKLNREWSKSIYIWPQRDFRNRGDACELPGFSSDRILFLHSCCCDSWRIPTTDRQRTRHCHAGKICRLWIKNHFKIYRRKKDGGMTISQQSFSGS